MPINTATLSGNLGADPEVRYTPSGNVITSLNMAVKGYGKEAKTLWFTCKAFKQTAEFIGEYAKKGDTVTVSGSLDIEEWETDGQKRSKTVLIIRDIQLPRKGE